MVLVVCWSYVEVSCFFWSVSGMCRENYNDRITRPMVSVIVLFQERMARFWNFNRQSTSTTGFRRVKTPANLTIDITPVLTFYTVQTRKIYIYRMSCFYTKKFNTKNSVYHFLPFRTCTLHILHLECTCAQEFTPKNE